jgi:RNA polymerase sigma-70 factor (ECF subfamily)
MERSNSEMAGVLTNAVAAAKAGDRKAFEELVRATCADTYTLAYRLTGNEEDAQDVVQEAYFRAWKGLKRFRGDANFTTWLYRITANCSSSHLSRRSRNRHQALDDEVAIPDERPEVDPEMRMGVAAERKRLNAALQSLPADMRSVVVLRDVYDLSHEAIAAELGISEGAAKVRLHRARKKLRERLYPLRAEQAQAEEDARAV